MFETVSILARKDMGMRELQADLRCFANRG